MDNQFDNINFSEIKTFNGGKFINITNDSNQLFIDLPEMTVAFNTILKNNENLRIPLALQLNSKCTDIIKNFVHDGILVDKILQFIMENSKKLFGKYYSKKLLYKFFCSNINTYNVEAYDNQHREYPEIFKTKIIRNKQGEYLTQFYNSKGDSIKVPTELKYGTKVKPIIHISGIWVSKKSFGLTMVISKLNIISAPKSKIYDKYIFIKDDLDLKEIEESMEKIEKLIA